MHLPKHIIGDSGTGTRQIVVRLHHPRFVALILGADEPLNGDWCWMAEDVERLVIVEWIDARPDDASDLVREAAVFAEIETADAYEQEIGE